MKTLRIVIDGVVEVEDSVAAAVLADAVAGRHVVEYVMHDDWTFKVKVPFHWEEVDD